MQNTDVWVCLKNTTERSCRYRPQTLGGNSFDQRRYYPKTNKHSRSKFICVPKNVPANADEQINQQPEYDSFASTRKISSMQLSQSTFHPSFEPRILKKKKKNSSVGPGASCRSFCQALSQVLNKQSNTLRPECRKSCKAKSLVPLEE